MKKFVFLIIIFFIGIFVLRKTFIFKKGVSLKVSPTPQALGFSEEESKNIPEISFEDKAYSVYLFEVNDVSKLNLIPNFEERLSSSEAVEKLYCTFLCNGGFYTKEGSPTGLFISQKKVKKNYVSNNILNAVLSVNDFATPRITRETPDDKLYLAVQTGPLLIENAKVLKLRLISDKPSRRVVAGITGENKLYFLVVYNKEQTFDGPYLIDLPEIVYEIGKKFRINFADAVNLDGGSASVYYTNDLKLSELSPVGSFFCFK